MSFPTRPDMTREQFYDEIIKTYFSHLHTGVINYQVKGAERSETDTDNRWKRLGLAYASIGAFLCNRAAVRKSWEKLEAKIRSGLTIKEDGSDAEEVALAGKKLLTNALLEFETINGFNNPESFRSQVRQQMLSEGSGATASLKTIDGIPTTALPRVAPIVTGENLDGQDFNKILLAHGYQFKDVGAGPAHGEHSHRLQWYAIGNAEEGAVDLQGFSLVDIFKSMGDWKWPKSWSMAGNNHLYIWESLFDNFKTESQARSQTYPTIAWGGNTFCCPEVVNDTLISKNGRTYRPTDLSTLFCLRVIVEKRFKKRSSEDFTFEAYRSKKLSQMATAQVGSATAGNNESALLMWKGR